MDLILWILATLCFGIAAFGGGRVAGWISWGWLGAMLAGLAVVLPD